ncbi:uncharacterized protein LOC142973523 [Anticarsia gemmatalis]|uniref:uncharacterized protein LOC142973523 n=1 Tax=Anticarsia gemmatalis TaxID=129554 RepID=UPI003F764AA7
MEETCDKIIKYISRFLLCKLSKEYYENDFRSEYLVRNNQLKEHFQELLRLLEDQDLINHSDKASSTLSYILILYLELLSKGPWNTEDIISSDYTGKLNRTFKNKYDITLDGILQCDKINAQEVFDKCIKDLHKNMTTDDFKKHPSLIEVYCLLVKDVKAYNIKLNPVTVLPVALLLIDDYVPANKIKGLKSCTAILQCLNIEDFTIGNYYDVVYSSLKKNIVEKDKVVTQELFNCFKEFLNLVPPDIKTNKLDDIFSEIVDQLYTESNLYRKADCFDFLTYVIEMHGIHCVKKKVFKQIICDNLDICSDDGVYEILLQHVLECLQTWVKYCWCVWKLSADHKMLSSLFKILYLTKKESTRKSIKELILTLINLCTEDEQAEIYENLQELSKMKCSNQDFVSFTEGIVNKTTE